MKASALKSLDRKQPQRNGWLALLGACVAVPHGARMAALATYCARVKATQPPLPPAGKARQAALRFNRQRLQRIKRRVALKLAALLYDALADLDPAPLENFAAIVRRLKQHDADRQAALPFHEKAMRLADVARLSGEPPLTQRELLRRMGQQAKEHDDGSRERKELKRLRISFAPGKPGRRPAQPGTRKRKTKSPV
jgi:hypothetical protein